MRISDWSSDVCSSDLRVLRGEPRKGGDDILQRHAIGELADDDVLQPHRARIGAQPRTARLPEPRDQLPGVARGFVARALQQQRAIRSEEHTSELQSLMRNPYAVFCLKKTK